MQSVQGTFRGTTAYKDAVLEFGPNQLFLIGRHEAPVWMRKRVWWRRPVAVTWHRVDYRGRHWWMGQRGRDVVILGQGPRPGVWIEEIGHSWRAMVPKGFYGTRIRLPRDMTVRARMLRG